MTRKHYELIAEALGKAIAEERRFYAHDTRDGAVMDSAKRDKAHRAEGASHAAWAIMEALESTNELFDRERFWQAVGKAEKVASDANSLGTWGIAPISWAHR